MKKKTPYIWMIGLVLLASTACKKDKEEEVAPAPPVNEEEVITTVVLKFTHNSGGASVKSRSGAG